MDGRDSTISSPSAPPRGPTCRGRGEGCRVVRDEVDRGGARSRLNKERLEAPGAHRAHGCRAAGPSSPRRARRRGIAPGARRPRLPAANGSVGTVIEAGRRHCSQAVLLVHAFRVRDPSTSVRALYERTDSDLDAFCAHLNKGPSDRKQNRCRDRPATDRVHAERSGSLHRGEPHLRQLTVSRRQSGSQSHHHLPCPEGSQRQTGLRTGAVEMCDARTVAADPPA